MEIAEYLELLHTTGKTLSESFTRLADGRPDDPEIRFARPTFAEQGGEHRSVSEPMLRRYGMRTRSAGGLATRRRRDRDCTGPLGLLRDLADISMPASFLHLT